MNFARYMNENSIKLEMETYIEPLQEGQSLSKWRQNSKEAILDELVSVLEFGFRVGSTYGDGGQVIGDPEKGTNADYKRPQDDLVSLYNTDTDTDEDKEFKDFIGWESDPLRPTHQQ